MQHMGSPSTELLAHLLQLWHVGNGTACKYHDSAVSAAENSCCMRLKKKVCHHLMQHRRGLCRSTYMRCAELLSTLA